MNARNTTRVDSTLNDNVLFQLAQMSQRFEGLKSFKTSHSTDPWRIVLWAVLVPFIGFCVLFLIRRLQKKRDEISAFSKAAKRFDLQDGEIYLLQRLADRKKIADPVRIVQSPKCFGDCTVGYLDTLLTGGKDPASFLMRTDKIREKLGFRKTRLASVTHSSQLDLPRKATLCLGIPVVRVPVLLIPRRPDGLAAIVLSPEKAKSCRKGETIPIEAKDGSNRITLTFPIRSIGKKGPYFVLNLAHSQEVFLTEQGRGTKCAVTIELPGSSDGSAPHLFPISVLSFDGSRIELQSSVPLSTGSEFKIHFGEDVTPVSATTLDSNTGVGSTHVVSAKVMDPSSASIATINALMETG